MNKRPSDSIGASGIAQFEPPANRGGHVFRPRLMDESSSARMRHVLLVRAPAGYGKSTFAAQWCRSDERPAAWLSLRDSDNDVVQLLHRLTAALEGLDPVDPELLNELNTPEPAIVADLVPRFLDDLDLRMPTQLCLDDAQLIVHPMAIAVLKGLANSIPDGSQLVLVSRSYPAIGLARIRAAGDLQELGAADLALTEGETRQMFALAGVDLSDEETTRLCSVTEGWAAALALAAIAHTKSGQLPSALLSPRRRDVADYFREEVLDLERDEVRQFLIDTSMVDRLSGPLCDAMTGLTGSAMLLSDLAETNLFVIPMDEGREWFRYHHLFQELLQGELYRRNDDRITGLYARAAAWHEEHGDPAESFEYARRGNDFDRAGRILLRNWDYYLGTGRSATVMGWLDRCEGSGIESDPQFDIAAGWITGHLGDAERASRFLAAAERADLDAPSADGATTLRASMLLLRASLGTGGARMMLEDSLAFVGVELPVRGPGLFEGYLNVGLAHLLLGHSAEAINAFNETLVLTEKSLEPHHLYARAYCLGLVALIDADCGEWARADRHARLAEELLAGLDLVVHRLPMLTARAAIAAHAGDREGSTAALSEAREIMPAALAIPYLQAELSLRCAQTAQQLGDENAAKALASDAESASHRVGDLGLIPERLRIFRERMGGVDPLLASLTPAERRVLRQLASHRTRREIADRLFVSTSTIKSHVAAIYAKLGVNSRTAAVAALGSEATDGNVNAMQLDTGGLQAPGRDRRSHHTT
jgi:LuxR family maltose regulon positive regulatory protein